MKKIILCLLLAITLQIAFVSAINLTIEEETISSAAIIDTNKPAIFELDITLF